MQFSSMMVNVMAECLLASPGCVVQVLGFGGCLEMVCMKTRLEWSSVGRAWC